MSYSKVLELDMKNGMISAGLVFAASMAGAQSPYFIHAPVDTDSLSTFIPAGAIAGSDPITKLVADDVLLPAAFTGQSISEIRFHLSNQSDFSTLAVRPRLRFWQDNGGLGGPNGLQGPGSYLAAPGLVGITGEPVTLHRGTSVDQILRLDPGVLNVPSGRFWFGITLDNSQNGNGLATVADLNQIGVGLGQVTPGQSTSALFATAAPGSFFNVLNPAGTFENVGSPTAGNLRVSLAVKGQDFTGTISLNDVTGMASTRTIQYTVSAGALVLGSGDLVVGTASPTQSFTFTTPFVAPGGGSIQVSFDGSTFLRRVVNLPAPGSTPVEIALGTIALMNGDVDRSGEVDAADIDLVIADFGGTDTGDTDVDVSGEVDAADIDIVIANFGATDE